VIPDGNILTINFGSFSIKFSLVDHQKSSHLIRGSVERIGQENASRQCATANSMASNRTTPLSRDATSGGLDTAFHQTLPWRAYP
jgi:acetate kinase